VREQLFLKLKQELPYATGGGHRELQSGRRGESSSSVDPWSSATASAASLVGKGGTMIRDLGSQARARITTLLGGRPPQARRSGRADWTTSPEALARLG